ncbi:MAG: hypothetical protein M1821_000990 [Bathelium mastoideum]|nr:MAG: hypothetical protein M1821_000990 [Bathelium mastoideum]
MADAITSAPAKSSLGVLWWAARHPPQDPTTSFVGKTVLITGPNTGLGFEAAVKFAALGTSKLLFGVRSIDKGQEAKARIQQMTGCKQDVIEVFQLDMGSFSSVERFVDQVTGKHSAIHAAVLNAGVAPPAHKASPEGWEMGLQVNVISTAYLAILLLPKLRETGTRTGQPTHLEFVSSIAHGDIKAEAIQDETSILAKLNDKSNFKFTSQYSITKLLEMWVMVHVAEHASPSQVIVNACCPSLCRSTIGRDFSIFLRGPDTLVKMILGRTTEQGSRILVSGVTVGERGHGGFWSHDRVAEMGLMITTPEGKKLGQQFWSELLDVLRRRNPKVESILSG